MQTQPTPLLQAAWFALVLVTPKMYQIAFNFEKLTLFCNMQSLLVHAGAWRRPEQLATAFLFNLLLFFGYWASIAYPFATGRTEDLPNSCMSYPGLVPAAGLPPPPLKCVWDVRNVFVHAILPAATVLTCLARRPTTFARRDEAVRLTFWLCVVFGTIQLLRPREPPPNGIFPFVAPLDDNVARFGTILLCVPFCLLQYGVHRVMPEVR